LAGPLQPPAPPVLPALQPPPSPEKAKAAGPPPAAEKAKTEQVKMIEAPKPPPPGPQETKTKKGPLEDNLNLQKELLDLAPKLSPITIK
jgi:hypothetical protein